MTDTSDKNRQKRLRITPCVFRDTRHRLNSPYPLNYPVEHGTDGIIFRIGGRQFRHTPNGNLSPTTQQVENVRRSAFGRRMQKPIWSKSSFVCIETKTSDQAQRWCHLNVSTPSVMYAIDDLLDVEVETSGRCRVAFLAPRADSRLSLDLRHLRSETREVGWAIARDLQIT